MSDTPIVDRLNQDGKAHYMALETARQLERMCAELNHQLELMLQFTPKWADVLLENNQKALARWQAMKDGK